MTERVHHFTLSERLFYTKPDFNISELHNAPGFALLVDLCAHIGCLQKNLGKEEESPVSFMSACPIWWYLIEMRVSQFTKQSNVD